MPASGPLFARSASAPVVPAHLPLVIVLTGFTDAGSAATRMLEYFRDESAPQALAVFDNDLLLDYRARRPVVMFDGDHLGDYRALSLELSLATDSLGQPFLLLAGYEPDFAWEAFVAAVQQLTEGFRARSVTWVHSIPMPVPHTRPIGSTVSGTRAELTEAHSVWRPHTQVPATVGHLLELRFSETDADVAGFVLLIPHYLADTEYPAAALAGLDSLTVATGLVFGGESLREENREFLEKVDEQVEGSDELSRMLEGLEEKYDAYMAGETRATPIIHTGDLPTADELAAELERFLANRPSGDDDRRPGL